LIFLVVLLVSGCFSMICYASDRYIWPIEITGNISGNFGECRWDHFHAGLDISTNGITGYRLFAIADGYVHRVRTSVAGYGKAIYLKLDDGRYVVYAHLERFIPEIQQYAKKHQKETGSYEVNLYPKKEMFRFKQGDIIGYSGKSGDVAPHLHIELRNSAENPINILTNGLALKKPDKTYPIIKHLAIKPFSMNSSVDNCLQQLLYRTEKTDDSSYKISTPISVWGKIGLKIDVTDKIDSQKYILTVHRLNLFVDGILKYSVSIDRFSYDSNYHNNFFLYDRELKYVVQEKLAGDYLRLYKIPEINLPMYKNNDADGILYCGDSTDDHSLPAGIHKVMVEAIDAGGNTTRLNFSLNVTPPEEASIVFAPPVKSVVSKISVFPEVKTYDDFFSILLKTSDTPAEIPAIDLQFLGNKIVPSKTTVHNNHCFEYFFRPSQSISGLIKFDVKTITPSLRENISSHSFLLFYIDKNDGGIFLSDDKVLSIRINRNNRTVIIKSIEKKLDIAKSDLKRLSKIYQISPHGFDLSEPALVQFKKKNISDGAIFEWMGNHWRLLYRVESNNKDIVVAKINHLSTFAVFMDKTAPRIDFVFPKKSDTLVRLGETISCHVEDTGVGLSTKKIIMKINGQRVPAEYIFDTNRLDYVLDEPLSTGENVISISAHDRLGNSTTKQLRFFYKN